MTPLAIGGLVPFSTVDYPRALSAVVFCQGCPWSCRYCHNPHLQTVRPALSWAQVRDDLRRRQGLLGAVVFSGGEPLLQPGLAGALDEVRGMGFRTGLHTGGYDPVHLASLLPGLDWVGLDIKAPRHRYDALTGSPGSADAAWASLAQLQSQGCWHEVRTTWQPRVLPEGDLLELATQLFEEGVREWVIQGFRAEGCRDEGLLPAHLAPEWLASLGSSFRGTIVFR